MTRTVFISIFFFFLFPLVSAQSVTDGIVKILITDASGNQIRSGSGIVTGTLGNEIYILTARHVLTGGTDVMDELPEGAVINVQFGFAELHGKLFKAKQYREESGMDVAVITATVNTDIYLDFHTYRIADYEKIADEEPVNIIGYPHGVLNTNDLNKVNKSATTANTFSTSGIGIYPGFSGGVVTLRKKDQFVGMITNVEPGVGLTGVQSDVLIDYLRAWRVPFELIRKPRRPIKIVTIVLGAASIGSGTASYLLNESAKDDYAIYKERRDETAPLYTDESASDYVGKSRNELKKSADDKRTMAAFALGTCAASAVAAGLVQLLPIRNDHRFSIHFTSEPVYGSYAYNQIGITLNF